VTFDERGRSADSLDPPDYPDRRTPAPRWWVDEHRGDQVEDRGHVRRPPSGRLVGRTLKRGGDTVNVLLLMMLLLTAFAAVVAMQTDEQSNFRR